MGNTYRLRLIKAGVAPVECAGKVAGDNLQLTRANGEVLYGFPLGRVAGLSHPAPNVLKVKLVVGEGSVGTLELQEAGVGGGFAPVTALYTELVKSLEGMKGKRRHRAASMDPIAMSDFLKQQARAAGAPPDPTAFLTLDGGGAPAKPPSTPQARTAPPGRPAAGLPERAPMVTNAAFEQEEAPGMFDDEEEEDAPLPNKAVRFGDLGAEVQSMRIQLTAAQQRLSSQAATHAASIATLERRIATLQTELQEAMTAAQRAEANIGRQAGEQLRSVINERDAALQRAQDTLQAREAALAELDGAQAQLGEFQGALEGAQREAEARSRELEEAQREKGLLRAQLDALDRDQTQQEAGELAEALQTSQQDAELLSQALEASQAALEERAAAYEAQIEAMQQTLAQAEDAINATNSALSEAQAGIARLEEDLAAANQRLENVDLSQLKEVDHALQAGIARLEEDLAAANQRLENADLSGGELQEALEETQAALRQAQAQLQASADQTVALEGQVARAEADLAATDAARTSDQAEVAVLRSQLEELQGAVGQAVEEIEAQNAAQVQQQTEREALLNELAEAQAQAKADKEGREALQKEVESSQAELAAKAAMDASTAEAARLPRSDSASAKDSAALTEAERRIAELQEQLAEAQQEQSAQLGRDEADANAPQVENLQQQLRTAQTAVAALQSELASMLKQPASTDSPALEGQMKQLQEELQLAKHDADSSLKDSLALDGQVRQLQEELQLAKRGANQSSEDACLRCSELSHQVEQANQEADEVVIRLDKVEAELRAANRELEKVVSSREKLHEGNARLHAQLNEQQQRLRRDSATEKLHKSHEGLVAQLEAELKDTRAELANAQDAAALAEQQSMQAAAAGSDAAARKLRHLEIQLADAETRAQSHAVILQQHQQRKETQEKKVAALQVKLEQLERDSESALDSLQQEADARLAESERAGVEERQAMHDAAERADTVISQLQEENERVFMELDEARKEAKDVAGTLESCRKELEEAQAMVARLSSQLAALSDQAQFDSARCLRLQEEVATLTKHLQDTNSDLQQSNGIIEALEAAGAAPSPTAIQRAPLRPPQHEPPQGRVTEVLSPLRAISAESISTPTRRDSGPGAASPAKIASGRKTSLKRADSVLASPRKPSLTLSNMVAKPSGFQFNTSTAQKPSRASLALDIEAAGKLLQHLSARLEAAGLPTPPSSRRQSSGVFQSPGKDALLSRQCMETQRAGHNLSPRVACQW